jgi:hypothetical protein
LLSIWMSLSTVRPMMMRPVLSGRSSTCSPPWATMMRASTSSLDTAAAAVTSGSVATPARMRFVRAANSTHCSSSMAALSSVVDTMSCPEEKAIRRAVSQSVLMSRGTPPV